MDNALPYVKLLVEAIVEEHLEEAAFGSFNLKKFKSLTSLEEMTMYLRYSGLKFLGQGSTRAAYAISTGKVLKVVKPEHDPDHGHDYRSEGHPDFGYNQMSSEIMGYLKYHKTLPGCFAEIFDYDPDHKWLISEPVRTFSDGAGDGSLTTDTGLTGRNLTTTFFGGRNSKFKSVKDLMTDTLKMEADKNNSTVVLAKPTLTTNSPHEARSCWTRFS